MPTLNIADLSLAIIWLFFSIRGYLRGLVKEVGSLAAIVMGFYCAGHYHKALAPHLTGYISGNYADTAAYLLIFTVTLIAVWFAALAVSGMVKVTMTQWADRFFGGVFGLAKGVILTAVLLFLIHLAAPNPDFLKGSVLVPVLGKVSARLTQYIPPDINEKMRKFGKKPEAEKKPLPASAAVSEKKSVPPQPESVKKPAEQTKSASKQPAAATAETPHQQKAPEKKPTAPAKAVAEKNPSPTAQSGSPEKPKTPPKPGADTKQAKPSGQQTGKVAAKPSADPAKHPSGAQPDSPEKHHE